MPSSQKTSHLNLNNWSGSDKPKRTDWNSDNSKIDTAVLNLNNSINNHLANSGAHVTVSEKNKWNNTKGLNVTSYTGNGEISRVITLGATLSFVIIFAVGKPTLSSGTYLRCYSGYGSALGSSHGITVASNKVTVRNIPVDPSGFVLSLNENNVSYVCVYQ